MEIKITGLSRFFFFFFFFLGGGGVVCFCLFKWLAFAQVHKIVYSDRRGGGGGGEGREGGGGAR